MASPIILVDDFVRAFLKLLPRGRVWPKDPGSTLARSAAALMPTYEINGKRAGDVVREALPATTLELLPEWEQTLSLPDPCQGMAPTMEARRAQVIARFSNPGSQSIPHMVRFAADLGYTITITEFAPSTMGMMRAGDPIMAEGAQFMLRINAQTNTAVSRFKAGLAGAGEPLSTYGNAVLECELNSIKPAHSAIVFTYS